MDIFLALYIVGIFAFGFAWALTKNWRYAFSMAVLWYGPLLYHDLLKGVS